MDVNQLLEVLWRHKLVLVALVAVMVGIAVGALKVITPVYESTAIVALRPASIQEDLVFFQTIDAIIPIYASGATSTETKRVAAQKAGGPLGSISIETFSGTPIMKIKARDASPGVAQRSAQAIADVLVEQVEAGDLGVPSLRMIQIDRPSLPVAPVFPKTKLTLAVGALVGLLLGVLGALLRENLTSKIRSAEELSQLSGVPCYAEIPNESAVARLSSPQDLITDPRLRPLSESLRDLRTNLLFANERIRSIVITSPEGHHGKTTIAFGLAVTLALTGTKTLLVDGDLRRGRLAEMLRIVPVPGLSDALTGTAIENVVRRTSLTNLSIVTRGRIVHDPSELLMTRYPALLRALEEKYEAIVIDSTPLVPVNDARIMASFAATTVLVASADGVTRRSLRAALERLSVISVKPTATVLNRSKTMRDSSYYTTTVSEKVTAPRAQ